MHELTGQVRRQVVSQAASGDPNSGGDSRIFEDLLVDVKQMPGRPGEIAPGATVDQGAVVSDVFPRFIDALLNMF